MKTKTKDAQKLSTADKRHNRTDQCPSGHSEAQNNETEYLSVSVK